MKHLAFLLTVVFVGLVAAGCEPAPPQTLTVYSGRSESLVQPLIEKFEARAGIPVNVKYGGSSELAVLLTEEGAQSSADVFWAQDGGALGAVAEAGLFAVLPDSLTGRVPAAYRNAAGTWVATSGRARTLAYSTERVDADALPRSIFDLTAPAYRGRVGWAPANASFQSFVTAMRKLAGEERTRAWLAGMRDNEAKSYPKNSAIIQAIADGEIDFGLPNHYYLLRFKSEDPNFPVAQTFFAPGDPGNLVNVAGAGVLAAAPHQEAALRFVAFLLSEEAQTYFTNEVHEYPVVEGVPLGPGLVPLDSLQALQPRIDLEELRDLEATLALLRDVGVL